MQRYTMREVERQDDGLFLLHSKLTPPSLPHTTQQLPRPAIVERLIEGFQRKLTLVVAPAGFGKTTSVLLALQQQSCPVSWLSLEPTENQLPSFLNYLIASLCQHIPDLGHHTLRRLQGFPLPPLHRLLGPLLNELQERDTPCLLVLDDFHNVNTPEIEEAMLLLLQHTPAHFRVVLTSRTQPSWPLSLWRARMFVTEINATALRLTAQESHSFLQLHPDLQLNQEEETQLHQRTEGWISALQLAGLSLKQTPNKADFFRDFTGENQYISDFLLQEVYMALPEDMRAFLLESSIFSTFTAELCDQISERADSTERLKELAEAQVFLVPLDAKRQWYRYHHLFQQWLRERLRERQPDTWQMLHRRAAKWYQSHGSLEQALEHCFAIDDMAQATKWLTDAAPRLASKGKLATLHRWLTRIPLDSYRASLPLAAVYTSLAILQGHIRQLAQWLTQLLSQLTPDTCPDHEQSTLALLQAHAAWLQRDKKSCLQWSTQARKQITPDTPFLFVEAGLLQCRNKLGAHGIDDTTLDDCESLRAFCIAHHNLFHLPPLVELYATLLVQQGHIQRATLLCEQTLTRINTHQQENEGALPASAPLLVRLANNAYQQCNFQQAQHHLLHASQLAQDVENKRLQHIVQVTKARLCFALGEHQEALSLLKGTEYFATDPSKRSSWEMAHTAWLCYRLHQQQQWDRWVTRCQPFDGTSIRFGNLFDGLVWASSLVWEEKWEEASSYLPYLASAGTKQRMTGYLWRVRLLQAQVLVAQGKQTEASGLLLPVLQETAAEHAYQLYLEHGKSIGPLLSKTLRTASKSKRQAIQEHVHRLLELLPSDTPSTPTPTPTSHQAPVEPDSISLQRYQLDPLSPRELEVLELIALGYTNQALSQQLHISLATVKTHTRNIYSKLDVKNRTQAAQQARTLGILPTRA